MCTLGKGVLVTMRVPVSNLFRLQESAYLSLKAQDEREAIIAANLLRAEGTFSFGVFQRQLVTTLRATIR